MTFMKAAVLEEMKKISVQTIEVPMVAANEVLIRVHCIGVCGSDIHYYEHGRIGNYIVEKPIILGHELAGTIAQLGSEVTGFEIGDRVAVEPGVTCGTCSYCKQGRYNLCPKVVFMATPPIDGAWAEYVTIRADFIYKLPVELSFEDGAMLEPLSVGFHALQRAGAKPEHKVLITGLGPIGQLTAVAAQLIGLHQVYGSDVVAYRRELAMQHGFNDVCDPAKDSLEALTDQWTNQEGFDIVIESSGSPHAIASLTKVVKRGGKIVLIGLSAVQSVPICTNDIVDGEIDVLGVFRYANTYPKLISLMQQHPVDLKPYITHEFSLDDIHEALNTSIEQKDSSMKIMIYP